MTAIESWATPTRLTGMCLYSIAALACAYGWRSGSRGSRLLIKFAIVEALLLVDMVLDIRWRLHDLADSVAVKEKVYEARHEPQLVSLLLVSASVCFVGIWIVRRMRGSHGIVLAAVGVTLSVGCWLSEVISLHALDAVYYHALGPVMVICVFWFAGCAMTTTGALLDAQS